MIDNEIRRIAVFEYDWSMYSFIRDLVFMFAKAGYSVDIFQKNPHGNLTFTNLEQFKNYPNIRYFDFSPSENFKRKITNKFKKFLGEINSNILQSPKIIIDGEILRKSKKIIKKSKYLCFIGIEKKGLIWAGILSRLYEYPLIYYSLELYLEDHPGASEYFYLRKAEKLFHHRSAATIIQDELRAKALCKFNEVESPKLLYFPISVSGNLVKNKSNYIHQKYQIDASKKIILSFGQIQEERFSSDLVRIAYKLSDDQVLVLHGFGEVSYLDYLKTKADPGRIFISIDFVEEEKILDVISSAKIGLALYQTISSNDRLAAFSSVKMAYYMQCGIPVIAFETESFKRLMNLNKCGELINTFDEIPEKINIIFGDYDNYRKQAFLAFQQIYEFDQNFSKFILDFEGIINYGLG